MCACTGNELGDSTSLFQDEPSVHFRDITNTAEILELPVAGRDSKVWIELDGKRFMLKTDPSVAIAEHVGSRFFNELGIKELGVAVQHTELVMFNGKLACLISDVVEGKELRTFKCVLDSALESESVDESYTFKNIECILDRYCDADWTFVQNLEYRFLWIFVVDAILANSDRHGGNWGYLCDGENRYFCDVFDNGASLFPDMMDFCNISKQQWHTLVIDSPKSAVQLAPGAKSTFYQLFRECQDLVDTSWISLNDVVRAIECATQGVNASRAEFYKKLVWLRYKCIVEGCEFNEAFRLYRS